DFLVVFKRNDQVARMAASRQSEGLGDNFIKCRIPVQKVKISIQQISGTKEIERCLPRRLNGSPPQLELNIGTLLYSGQVGLQAEPLVNEVGQLYFISSPAVSKGQGGVVSAPEVATRHFNDFLESLKNRIRQVGTDPWVVQ